MRRRQSLPSYRRRPVDLLPCGWAEPNQATTCGRLQTALWCVVFAACLLLVLHAREIAAVLRSVTG